MNDYILGLKAYFKTTKSMILTYLFSTLALSITFYIITFNSEIIIYSVVISVFFFLIFIIYDYFQFYKKYKKLKRGLMLEQLNIDNLLDKAYLDYMYKIKAELEDFAFPSLSKIMTLLNMSNTILFLKIYLVTYIVFSIIYVSIYAVTTRAYQKVAGVYK